MKNKRVNNINNFPMIYFLQRKNIVNLYKNVNGI